MKNFLVRLLAVLSIAAASLPAHASVETFDSATTASSHGFTLSSNILFSDPGRPYLEYWDQSHTITSSVAFTFNSIDLNYVPWTNFQAGSGDTIKMTLLDASNHVLLNTSIGITPGQGWLTYSNTIANVSSIYFAPTNGFWPSFDNLQYNVTASVVPEPSSIALIGLGLLGCAALRRKATK